MSDRVTIGIDVDTTAAQASMKDLKEQADELTRQHKINRNTLLREIREGFTLISQMMSTFRQGMSLIGAQVDPFFSAMVGMVLSTTSMLISSASVLSATVLGAPVGAILFGLAISFNILTMAKLVADKLEIGGTIRQIQRDVFLNVSSARPAPSFGGGF